MDFCDPVGTEDDTDTVHEFVGDVRVERLVAVSGPPVVLQDLDLDTVVSAADPCSSLTAQVGPFVGTQFTFHGHRPGDGRRLRFERTLLAPEAPLVVWVYAQVRSDQDVPIRGEDLACLALRIGDRHSQDTTEVAVVVRVLPEEFDNVAIDHVPVAVDGLAPDGLDREHRYSTDALSRLDPPALCLFRRLPAAVLDRAIFDQVHPPPMRFREEARGGPRGFLASGCPSNENTSRECVSIRYLDIGSDTHPAGFGLVVVVARYLVVLGYRPLLGPIRPGLWR